MDMTHPDSRIVERYAYCLCLHVKPATIFIGSIRLAEALLHAARYLTAVFYNGPEIKINQMAQYQAAIPLCLLSASVSAILLYGVTKSKPACLMPFFWLRLCEFMALLPSFISSLYDHPIHGMYDAHPGMPKSIPYERPIMWPQGHSQPPKSLFFTTMVLMVQGYFLCVVWKCFRYLKVRELILPLHMPRSNGTDLVIPPGIAPPPINLNISPPDYETATKGNGPPPPDYETAMKHQPAEKSVDQTTLGEEVRPIDIASQSLAPPSNITTTLAIGTIESQAGPSGSIQESQQALNQSKPLSTPPSLPSDETLKN